MKENFFSNKTKTLYYFLKEEIIEPILFKEKDKNKIG